MQHHRTELVNERQVSLAINNPQPNNVFGQQTFQLLQKVGGFLLALFHICLHLLLETKTELRSRHSETSSNPLSA